MLLTWNQFIQLPLVDISIAFIGHHLKFVPYEFVSLNTVAQTIIKYIYTLLKYHKFNYRPRRALQYITNILFIILHDVLIHDPITNKIGIPNYVLDTKIKFNIPRIATLSSINNLLIYSSSHKVLKTDFIEKIQNTYAKYQNIPKRVFITILARLFPRIKYIKNASLRKKPIQIVIRPNPIIKLFSLVSPLKSVVYSIDNNILLNSISYQSAKQIVKVAEPKSLVQPRFKNYPTLGSFMSKIIIAYISNKVAKSNYDYPYIPRSNTIRQNIKLIYPDMSERTLKILIKNIKNTISLMHINKNNSIKYDLHIKYKSWNFIIKMYTNHTLYSFHSNTTESRFLKQYIAAMLIYALVATHNHIKVSHIAVVFPLNELVYKYDVAQWVQKNIKLLPSIYNSLVQCHKMKIAQKQSIDIIPLSLRE